MAVLTTEEANKLLPQAKVGTVPNPKSLVYTLIAEPKFGKTTWMSQIPNSLLLAFERGHSFIEAHKIEITAWAAPNSEIADIGGLLHMTFEDAVTVICASDQFDFVIFDTADMAAKMCLDYHLKKFGLTHAQDWEYGKGHDVCLNTPFRQLVNKIASSGRGVGFITHSETKDSRFSTGTKARKECTLPGGVMKYVIPQSDIVLHGKFGARGKDGRRSRIIVTEGSDDMLAGSRVQGKFRLPTRFIVDPNNPWAQWESFFTDPEASFKAEADYEKAKRTAPSTGTDTTDAAAKKAEAEAGAEKPLPRKATTSGPKK